MSVIVRFTSSDGELPDDIRVTVSGGVSARYIPEHVASARVMQAMKDMRLLCQERATAGEAF